VPLSDREQKILQEIEKNLYDEDPRFARDVRRQVPRMNEMRRTKLGAAVFVLGFVVLLAFFMSRSLIVGVVAFGAMVAGIVLISGSIRGIGPPSGGGVAGRRSRLVHKFEEWEARLRKRYKRP
jgi:hypothetical protein